MKVSINLSTGCVLMAYVVRTPLDLGMAAAAQLGTFVCAGQNAGRLLDPVLKVPEKIAEKLTQWTTSSEHPDENRTVFKQRVHAFFQMGTAALATFAAHRAWFALLAAPLAPSLAPLALGGVLGVYNLAMSWLFNLKDRGNKTLAGGFDGIILRKQCVSLTDHESKVCDHWQTLAFVVASLWFTPFFNTPILALAAAYTIGAVSYSVLARYYQIGKPNEEAIWGTLKRKPPQEHDYEEPVPLGQDPLRGPEYQDVGDSTTA